jgi:hypothetical protein
LTALGKVYGTGGGGTTGTGSAMFDCEATLSCRPVSIRVRFAKKGLRFGAAAATVGAPGALKLDAAEYGGLA